MYSDAASFASLPKESCSMVRRFQLVAQNVQKSYCQGLQLSRMLMGRKTLFEGEKCSCVYHMYKNEQQ